MIPIIHLRLASDKRRGGHYATSACGLPGAWTNDYGICLECDIALERQPASAREEFAARVQNGINKALVDGLLEPADEFGRMRITKKGMRDL